MEIKCPVADMHGRSWKSRFGKFMAHSAVWCYLPIQKQNKNSKKLTEENLSENSLSSYKKFGWDHLKIKKNKTFVDLEFLWDFPI